MIWVRQKIATVLAKRGKIITIVKKGVIMDNKNENRYCEPFNMTPQEFYDYKAGKFTRLIPYAIAMIISTLFYEKWTGYIMFTAMLIWSYVHDAKCEAQWKKDGSMRDEDLK